MIEAIFFFYLDYLIDYHSTEKESNRFKLLRTFHIFNLSNNKGQVQNT